MLAAVLAGVVASPSSGAPLVGKSTLCSAGYVNATVEGQPKCLRSGEFCSAQDERDYQRYGFACLDGRLTTRSSSVPTSAASSPSFVQPTWQTEGATLLLTARPKQTGCVLGGLPDRRCSPGAYAAGLKATVLCNAKFRTDPIRHVSEATKRAVEAEYGMTPKSYGSTLEIDHIVSLEIGGSNNIANLFPERAVIAGAPGYHLKDKLENKLHALVCSGSMTLKAVQRAIASNWETLYKRVFGVAP